MQCDYLVCVDGNLMSFILVHAYSFNENSDDQDNDEKDTHREDIGERESEDTSEGKKKDTYQRKQEDTQKRKGDELLNSEEEDVPLHHSRHTSQMTLFPSSKT